MVFDRCHPASDRARERKGPPTPSKNSSAADRRAGGGSRTASVGEMSCRGAGACGGAGADCSPRETSQDCLALPLEVPLPLPLGAPEEALPVDVWPWHHAWMPAGAFQHRMTGHGLPQSAQVWLRRAGHGPTRLPELKFQQWLSPPSPPEAEAPLVCFRATPLPPEVAGSRALFRPFCWEGRLGAGTVDRAKDATAPSLVSSDSPRRRR